VCGSSQGKEIGTVHGFAPPPERESTSGQLLRVEASSCARCGRRDVERVRGRAGGSARRSAQPDSPWSVSGTALKKSLHTEGRGRQRPLGIAALEDKVVQQAVVAILNEIYEVDF
jgi:hypothetical protein